MRICGFDPGSNASGYGILDINGSNIEVVDYGFIKTDKSMTKETKMKEIFLSASHILEKYMPDICGVEEAFFWKNMKTTMYLSEVRSVIILASALKDIPVYNLSTTTIKKSITGKGRANKKSVQFMLHHLLGIKATGKDFDATDALAVAYTCYKRFV